MKYSQPIRILHALLAFAITLQLLLSTVMRQLRPGRARTALEAVTFAWHQYVGLALVIILAVHWLLQMARHAPKGLAHLFPWFSRDRMERLKLEAHELLTLRLREPEKQDAIAGAFQGLGIVIATVMAITGCAVYFGMADDGTMSATTRSIRSVHTTVALLMWGYLGVHVAATLAHLAVGHRSILAIFRLRNR